MAGVDLVTDRWAVRSRVGLLGHANGLYHDLSVAENVFLGREPLKVPVVGVVDFARMAEMTRAVFAQLDVQIDPHALVRDLGVAQQQMVEIAKALSIDARLVMMDEPTAALDEKSGRDVVTLFQELTLLSLNNHTLV